MDKQLKIALPKGRLMAETAALLERAGWGLGGYHEGTRSYRLRSERYPELLAKIFHEKDIPIQVAVGNYDLGICGLDWVEELLAKYPSSALVKLRNLGYGEGALYLVASSSGAGADLAAVRARTGVVRLASEYPNLTESFALNLRLKRFSIFPVWGAAEAYPPESADLALISGRVGEGMFNHDLVAIDKVLDSSAYLIANRASWEGKNLSEVQASIEGALTPWLIERKAKGKPVSATRAGKTRAITGQPPAEKMAEATVRLALPDGHQQAPTVRLLTRAGIRVDDYPSATGNRRPTSSLPGVSIKVIRPQDMPLQVANGNFDLAITGRDWLTEHLYQFPSSPVTELVNLKFGGVRIVAVVSKDLPVTDGYELRHFYTGQTAPIRVASEYVNIADKYARDNRLGMYRVIPTWGASEAFVPEDADLLIENTQTGRTIARHNLKIIDTLFESTACLIGNRQSVVSPTKGQKIKSITRILRAAVEDF
ncbi:MAG: ATP phosphoribosyltransferase [Dehalococcoidales bacterium]|nr:ATP phosphoribosyltransferase [Dehalococcoidales bacterium]